MKRLLPLFVILLILVTLCGCGGQAFENRVLVVIDEAEGYTVENNGQLVVPGENATFTLRMDNGFSLAAANYAGASHFETSGKTVTLTLEAVAYPAVVSLSLTSRYCTITYDANGGAALNGLEPVLTRTYDLTHHRRPNTERGIDMFSREGYTLLCWNTKSDGTGERVGLGSRLTAYGHQTLLYAQWVKWNDAADFAYSADAEANIVTITGYSGSADTLVVPEEIEGKRVGGIAATAFRECAASSIVLPPSIEFVEDAAFVDCTATSVTLFDNIKSISDVSFAGCLELETLHINAIEAPYGYVYCRESCYSDKVDALILAQGQPKLVFYGGCSMWYNLDGLQTIKSIGDSYTVINLGLNGVVDSAVQMQIMGAYLESGDILFHTPEISSRTQLLINTRLDEKDSRLWAGIENNYDLFALVDLRTVDGAFDSLCHYLSLKDKRATYLQYYKDEHDRAYTDAVGSVPFYRGQTADTLLDKVFLEPDFITSEGMARLGEYYSGYEQAGVRVYVSYACVNIDAVPEKQRDNIALMDSLFSEAIAALDGPVLISKLEDYVYHTEDYFDTNYHLLSEPAKRNTELWLRDLSTQMEADGLWEVASEA